MAIPYLQPAVFLAHGNPMNGLQSNTYTDSWRALTATVEPPKAILVISAHWYCEGSLLCAASQPATLHDFSGFPAALFDCIYPCPGAPQLALDIMRLNSGVSASGQWGLDHGAWVPLLHIYPDANIPVLQLSIDCNKTAEQHWLLGTKLAYLRKQGVMILGSGNIVHNLYKWRESIAGKGSHHWAAEFDSKIAQALDLHDSQQLIHYQQHAHANDAVPTAEHYLPLLYIAAMRQPTDNLVQFSLAEDSLEAASMRSVRYGGI
ncbi:MAG: 4,5-DOPA dioxygenase extradiol [Pseudomonadales bacterium]